MAECRRIVTVGPVMSSAEAAARRADLVARLAPATRRGNGVRRDLHRKLVSASGAGVRPQDFVGAARGRDLVAEMETPRLFVALALPEVVRAELAAVREDLDGIRWSEPANLHLTLRFIGDCDAEKRDALAESLARVHVEPFVLPVEGLGVFPSRGPAKVIWAGLGGAHTRLFQLRKQVDEALLAVDMTIDVHSFQPHITLGRLGENYEAKALAKFLARHAKFEAPPFRVSEFHLMASAVRPGCAPEYSAVRTFALEK